MIEFQYLFDIEKQLVHLNRPKEHNNRMAQINKNHQIFYSKLTLKNQHEDLTRLLYWYFDEHYSH